MASRERPVLVSSGTGEPQVRRRDESTEACFAAFKRDELLNPVLYGMSGSVGSGAALLELWQIAEPWSMCRAYVLWILRSHAATSA
mmetsp:Transcript_5970/g.13790  ORF Transcript_5970/g.13790 Transcript_5970/m.13790 type:complete len:86 (+) Transcript_5970:226-483(+)